MKPSTAKPQEDLHTNEAVRTNEAAHEAEQNVSPAPTSSMIWNIYSPVKDSSRILNDEKRGINYLTASFWHSQLWRAALELPRKQRPRSCSSNGETIHCDWQIHRDSKLNTSYHMWEKYLQKRPFWPSTHLVGHVSRPRHPACRCGGGPPRCQLTDDGLKPLKAPTMKPINGSIRGYGFRGIKSEVWITLPTKYCVKDTPNMMQKLDQSKNGLKPE